VGAVIGWLLAVFAILSAGAGHGTYYPAAFFFGPLCVIWFLRIPNAPDWITGALAVITPFVYGGYALIVLHGITRHRGWRYAAWVLGIHWVGVAIATVLVYRDENGFSSTARILATAGPLIFFQFIAFALVHFSLWRILHEARSAGRD
jgi:hypothetical protein